MRTLLSLVLFGVLATTLHANGLSPTGCPTDSLADYISNFQSPSVGAPNGPCSAGILNYSEFNFESFFANSPSAMLGSSAFDLSPISPGQGNVGSTGFAISPANSPNFTLTSGSALYVLDWYFAIDAGPIASGASLGMDPTGDVSVTAEYCLDSFISAFVQGQADSCYNGPANDPDPTLQTLTVTPADLNAFITFSTPVYEFADVRTIISLNSDDGPAEFGGASSGTTIDPAPTTPEPGTLLLVPGGLAFFAFFRKRRVTQ